MQLAVTNVMLSNESFFWSFHRRAAGESSGLGIHPNHLVLPDPRSKPFYSLAPFSGSLGLNCVSCCFVLGSKCWGFVFLWSIWVLISCLLSRSVLGIPDPGLCILLLQSWLKVLGVLCFCGRFGHGFCVSSSSCSPKRSIVQSGFDPVLLVAVVSRWDSMFCDGGVGKAFGRRSTSLPRLE